MVICGCYSFFLYFCRIKIYKEMNKNTLYIIGNGFDIHHGIKSSYCNFHQWVKRESANNVRFAFTVFQLEKFFNRNCILWSDFEHNIGEYDIEVVAKPAIRIVSRTIRNRRYWSCERYRSLKRSFLFGLSFRNINFSISQLGYLCYN